MDNHHNFLKHKQHNKIIYNVLSTHHLNTRI